MAYLVPRSELESLCIRYRATAAKDFYVGKDVTRDKELLARKQLKVPATSSLLAVLDTTVLKTMEYGLAICEEGIFWVSSTVRGPAATVSCGKSSLQLRYLEAT